MPTLFELGQCEATEAALGALQDNKNYPIAFLKRHQAGDWGELRGIAYINQANHAAIFPGASLDVVRDAHFEHNEAGKIHAGVKWINAMDGPHIPHECYQFDTLAELKACARAYQNKPHTLSFSLWTHAGQYRNLRPVYFWARVILSAYRLADGQRICVATDSKKTRTLICLASQIGERRYEN